jgi:hypothetical protein
MSGWSHGRWRPVWKCQPWQHSRAVTKCRCSRQWGASKWICFRQWQWGWQNQTSTSSVSEPYQTRPEWVSKAEARPDQSKSEWILGRQRSVWKCQPWQHSRTATRGRLHGRVG